MSIATLLRSGPWILTLLALDSGAQTTAKMPQKIDPAALVDEVPGMVLVAAGECKIGSTPQDSWAESDEFPQRVVNIPAFYIDQFEVSNIEYKRFVDATGWPAPPSWKDAQYPEEMDFYPAVDVTWWDATAYARWVGKRLPTEMEWEKACAGPERHRFPWGDKFDSDKGNNDTNILPINSKIEGASAYGAINMAGNASEWTASVYAPYPQLDATLPSAFGGAAAAGSSNAAAGDISALHAKNAPQIRPDDPRLRFFSAAELQDDRPRVYRGGSFNSYARFLRCANREQSGPGARWPNLGFRCAKGLADADVKPR